MRRRLITVLLAVLTLTGVNAHATVRTLQFELYNGFILIEGKLNGLKSSYILDTGAPGLILNAKYHQGVQSDVTANALGGTLSPHVSINHLIQLNDFTMHVEEALCVDLSYLEKATGTMVTGLVGLQLFDGFDVIIDYPSRTIETIKLPGEDQLGDDYVRVNLEFVQHIAAMKLEVGDVSFLLGIDTGSKSNILNQKALKRVTDGAQKELRKIDLIGMDQKVRRTKEVSISGVNMGGMDIGAVSFVITQGNNLANHQLDGVLGHDFFKHCVILLASDRSYMYVRADLLLTAVTGL